MSLIGLSGLTSATGSGAGNGLTLDVQAVIARNSTAFGLDPNSLAADLSELSASDLSQVLGQLPLTDQGAVLRALAGQSSGQPGAAGATDQAVAADKPAEPAPVTADQIREIMPGAGDRADTYVGPLNDAMKAHGIDTPEKRAAFLAQIAVESGISVIRRRT